MFFLSLERSFYFGQSGAGSSIVSTKKLEIFFLKKNN